MRLQSSPRRQGYTPASVRIISGRTAGSLFFLQPPAMLLSPHMMTQNGGPVNAFSLMRTHKSHSDLSLVNKWDVKTHSRELWRGILLPFEIDVLVRYHAEDTSRYSARTESVYDEWISSKDIFEKCVASVVFFKCLETIFSKTLKHQCKIFPSGKVKGQPKRSLSSVDSLPSLKHRCPS
ncbi:hypothetical protein TNCV_3762611 [Trichonephila clavipes]|nr:hypothetical protein TNCV_3762611 [Trichonephila clavipes]